MVLLVVGFAFLFIGVGAAAVGYLASVAAKAPTLAELRPLEQGNVSTVYSADGKRLGFIQGDILRTKIKSNQIPQSLKEATVAIEDKRFYRHKGVDYSGLARATVKNISSGDKSQGGSTITMQLIRNAYQAGKEKTIERKVREIKLASELEKAHPGAEGKRWILNQYLNNIPYGTVGGQTAVGAEAAARVFFDKPAKDLTLKESALLAGLPQAPSQYNPFDNRRQAKQRRNQVLSVMAEQGYISKKKARQTKKKGLGVKPSDYYQNRREGYFFDYVKAELLRRYGQERVRVGGMKVYTTVSVELQRAARRAIENNLGQTGPSGALVSIDPKTGEIIAMASSDEYSASKFNLAAQGKRQPGSTFKTIVLMAALRQGIDINKVSYTSKPLDFFDRKTKRQITVKTFDNSYGGTMTVAKALVKSDNSVFQQLDLDVGPGAVRQTAYDLGITSKLDALPAEGLGGLTRGVSPLEMSRAYATINNGGYRIRPTAIEKVKFEDGTVDRAIGRAKKVKAFSDGETTKAVRVLEENVKSGTGTGADIGCPTAGKTGTTNNSTDAWFAGFTSSLNTTTWVGYPGAAISMGSMTGGAEPASIFKDFMEVAMKGRPCDKFAGAKEPFEPKPFSGQYAN